MSTTVSFPGLGLSFELNRVAFTVFGIDVYWYGVLLGGAIIIAILYASWRAKEFGLDSDRMLDVILVGAVFAVIGGRTYYILCKPGDFTTVQSWFDLRSGGIAMYGVLIGGFASAAVMCRLRKVKILPFFDIAALGFIMSQPWGRLANFVNQECFGYNTTLPWGMTSSTVRTYLTQHAAELAQRGMVVDPSLPVHPYWLYEALWTATGAVILNLYVKHRKFDGEIFLFYAIWYGTGRGVLESLRTDSLYVGPFRTSQLVSLIVVVLAVTAVIIVRAKKAKDPSLYPVWGHTEEAAEQLAAFKQAALDKKTSRRGKRAEAGSADTADHEETEGAAVGTAPADTADGTEADESEANAAAADAGSEEKAESTADTAFAGTADGKETVEGAESDTPAKAPEAADENGLS